MRCSLIMAILLAAGQIESVDAQWHVGLGVGRDVYTGVSKGQFEDGIGSFRPYRPLVWFLRIELPASTLRVSIDVRYATPDIGLVGGEVTLIPNASFLQTLGMAPAVGWTMVELTPGVTIEGEGGPVLERWRVEGVDDRTLLGMAGGLALRIGLGGSFAARLAARVGVTPKSPLAGALIDGYTPRTAWRRGLEGSVLVRL